MHWIIYALVGTFFIGIYNSFLESSKVIVPKGSYNKHMYLASILVIAGIINTFVLLVYSQFKPKEFKTLFIKLQKQYINKNIKIPYLYLIIPATLLSIYMCTNILALNGGGGIAIGIVNLNMFVTLTLGVMLLGDKINSKVIIGGLIAGLSISYAAYQSSLIN